MEMEGFSAATQGSHLFKALTGAVLLAFSAGSACQITGFASPSSAAATKNHTFWIWM